jgi:hypothetical protein
VKFTVQCPKCGATGELEIPDEKWAAVQVDVIAGRVTPGRICPHSFRFEVNRQGRILKCAEMGAAAAPASGPVRFSVQSALRSLGEEVLAALLTAGISEISVMLVGSESVTMGVRELMLRLLPSSVDPGALFYTATPEEYQRLPASMRKLMTVDVRAKTITNPAFDAEQLAWVRNVLMRAKMVQAEDPAEQLILQETSKLRTTVSLLRHLAARRSRSVSDEAKRKKAADESQK